MRFVVDSWEPDYGSPIEPASMAPSDVPVNIDVERPAAEWAPIAPAGERASTVLFVDGVRRIEARVWITGDDGALGLGIAASYAAGAVRSNGRAEVVAATVERRLLSAAATAAPIETRHGCFGCVAVADDSPDQLSLALQRQMGALETAVAREVVSGDDLVVVDGPLRQHGHEAGTVGAIKAQHRAYGPPVVQATIAALAAGQRTPVLVIGEPFPRWSWYVRLPGPVPHPMAAIVRCEATADLDPASAIALANRVAATLPRFASAPHKDARAPQNLYPIGGLERTLRHRLGDQQLVVRALRTAAAS